MQRGQARLTGPEVITITDEVIWGAVLTAGGMVVAAGKWMVQRAINHLDKRLESHSKRLARIEVDYVSKETLRQAVGEIKDTINSWGTDMKRSVDSAHTRLDTIYSELLKRP